MMSSKPSKAVCVCQDEHAPLRQVQAHKSKQVMRIQANITDASLAHITIYHKQPGQ